LNTHKMDVELDILSRILGHTNPKTTRETYIHFFNEDQIKLLKKLDESRYQKKGI